MSSGGGNALSWAELNDHNKRWYGALSVPARLRRAKLLMRAAKDRLRFHSEGGMALKDADVQWLLMRGYVKTVRVPYAKGWLLARDPDASRNIKLGYDLRYTKGVITEKGWDALWNERF